MGDAVLRGGGGGFCPGRVGRLHRRLSCGAFLFFVALFFQGVEVLERMLSLLSQNERDEEEGDASSFPSSGNTWAGRY